MGLFNPQSRKEQARYVCCENARFREELRVNRRMPNGTYGGVRGGLISTYSIIQLPIRGFRRNA